MGSSYQEFEKYEGKNYKDGEMVRLWLSTIKSLEKTKS